MNNQWWLRTQEDVFGPVSKDNLLEWAKMGRIQPGQDVSSDGETWIPATDIDFLDMRWSIDIGDGTPRGPFNKEAASALLASGRLPPNSILIESVPKFTGTVPVSDSQTDPKMTGTVPVSDVQTGPEMTGTVPVSDVQTGPEMAGTVPVSDAEIGPEMTGTVPVSDAEIDPEMTGTVPVSNETLEAKIRLNQNNALFLEVKQELENTKIELSETRHKLDDVVGKESACRSKLDETQAKLLDSQTKLEDAQTKLLDSQTKLEDAQTRLVDLQTKLEDAQTRLVDSQAQLDETQAKLDDAKVNLGDTQTKLEDTQSRLDEKVAELVELKKKLDSTETRASEAENEIKRLPANAQMAANAQAAVYALMREEADELAAALDAEHKEAELFREYRRARTDRLLARRQEILKHIGTDAEDMTRRALQAHPEDARTTHMRQELDAIRILQERSAREAERKINDLSLKLRDSTTEAKRLREQAADTTIIYRQLQETREKLAIREKELIEERQRSEVERQHHAAAQQALLARLSALEMGMPGGTNQSREARNVRLAPWMGLKK